MVICSIDKTDVAFALKYRLSYSLFNKELAEFIGTVLDLIAAGF